MSKKAKILEWIENLEKDLESHYADYSYYGLRFDSRDLDIDDVLEPSKSNIDREDSRDFPEYGTPEYDDLPELSGTCAYMIFDGDRESRYTFLDNVLSFVDDDDERKWYILGSKDAAEDEAEDEDEVVMIDPIVLEVL